MAKNDTKSVWETLSTVNVNDHKEEKNGLSYLSWAWAWGFVKNKYPSADYKIHDNITYPDNTVEVRVSVEIEDQTHMMWLPVMDYRNKAIVGPTSKDISDSRMRCLVKAISMHGLGHYIYAGEDLPQSGGAAPQSAEAPKPKPSTPKKNTPSTEAVEEADKPTPEVKSAEDLSDVRKTDGWDMVTAAFIELLPLHTKEDTLRQFWFKNKAVLAQLKDAKPNDHGEVFEAFKKRTAEIKGEAA